MKTVIKQTYKECDVKVSGGNGTSEVISLIEDVFSPYEEYVNPRANIIGLTWHGNAGSTIQIIRNGVIISTMQADTTGQFDFSGQCMVPDNVENSHDLVVNITGSQGECFIKLSKSGVVSINHVDKTKYIFENGIWQDLGVWKDQFGWTD